MSTTLAHRLHPLVLALLLAAPATLAGQSAGHGTPVRAEELGVLTTDRPGNVENPFTVAAGHFQAESNLFGYTRFGVAAPGVRVLDAAQFRLRAGLDARIEAQVVFNGYTWSRTAGTPWSRSSAGATTRLKINVRSEEQGGFAMGFIPALSMVRSADGDWTSTWALTGAVGRTTSSGWILGASVGVAASSAATGGAGVVSVARSVGGPVTLALEITAVRADFSAGTTEGRLGSGVMIALGSSAQLDLGIDAGIVNKANAYRTYLGVARRF